MTDQRNRVTTDPGLGPIEREHASTLRSITAAEPIADADVDGASVYYEPKPLHAASEHKTLELETVKLSKDIDPRKLPTQLKLRRPVLHVLPASDPNWPAPSSHPEVGWPPPQSDSGWPPPETVLTSSQPPLAARRRSFMPLVLFVVLCASLLVVLGARAWNRSVLPTVATQAAQPRTRAVVAAPKNVEGSPSAVPASSQAASVASASAPLPESAESAESAGGPVASAMASPLAAEPSSGAAPSRSADATHHPSFKSSSPIANSPALSAPLTAKPKRAIY